MLKLPPRDSNSIRKCYSLCTDIILEISKIWILLCSIESREMLKEIWRIIKGHYFFLNFGISITILLNWKQGVLQSYWSGDSHWIGTKNLNISNLEPLPKLLASTFLISSISHNSLSWPQLLNLNIAKQLFVCIRTNKSKF